jgi:hypothetical protein
VELSGDLHWAGILKKLINKKIKEYSKKARKLRRVAQELKEDRMNIP